MFLADNGKYYFDKQMKTELSPTIFDEIGPIVLDDLNIQHQKFIDNKKFIFASKVNLIVINEDQKMTELSFNPIDIVFKVNKKEQKIRIFSLEQYEKALKYFGIIFPWSHKMLLSKSNLQKLIYNSIPLNKSIEIEDINIFEKDFSDEPKKFCKLKDLSSYISYYLKSEINISEYPEKNYINEKDYILTPGTKFDYYMQKKRTLISIGFENICKTFKEYFITGNVSIGKNFYFTRIS